MPLTARMSLWGLYQYDHSILDNMQIPAGMDSDNLKQNLLVETAGMSILYPDPEFMKLCIGLWSAERLEIWNKLYDTTQLQYNPLENYDRIEETSESADAVSVRDSSQSRNADRSASGSDSALENGNESSNRETSGSSSKNDSGSESGSRESTGSSNRNQSGSNTATTGNTSYNSNTFADVTQTESSGEDQISDVNTQTEENDRDFSNRSDEIATGSENAGRDFSTNRRSDSVQTDRSSENSSESGRESRNDNRLIHSRIHGNIGVTTSQKMLTDQREVVQFCLTEFIINDFIRRFCVMVY